MFVSKFFERLCSVMLGSWKLNISSQYFIMRPSSLGGGRIMHRTLSVRLSVCPSVCLSVCLSVRPVIVRYRASRRAT